MPLEQMLIIRLKGDLLHEVEEIALKAGCSKSAIARNTLALCLMPPRKPNQVELILKKIKIEMENELYGRDDGDAKAKTE